MTGMTGMPGCGLAAADRAQDNRRYVRRLLKETQPDFAALLESLEAQFACPVCQAAATGEHQRFPARAAHGRSASRKR